ncbi:uncharacterized protein LOC116349845 [Contarinia nasturtii]|uniref:uncharacterized protein LOC116349845 n=1 Tax=Contarinia nasturtii TaxID=265458 RepID=UPI0012D379A0|nr:uncharacterized protein LOC116349845 [Contarinia nasturtii]
MPAKNRGKSAVSEQINLLNVNADVVLPSASPLKIESVVPRRNKNSTSRFLQRSYSTLNLRYLNTLISENHHQRKSGVESKSKQQLIKNTNRALDCNINSSGKRFETNENGSVAVKTSPSTTTVHNGTAFTTSNSTAKSSVQHGFWRIQRTTKEKEKFPDRINLDRRGLATLPLIVDEPNLRLLSLQHNLINSICVPASNSSNSNNNNDNNHVDSDSSSLITAIEFAKKSTTNLEHKQPKKFSTKATINGYGNGSNNNASGQHLLRAQSIQKPSSPSSSTSRTLSRNFSINSNAISRNRTTKTIDPNHRNATLIRENSTTTTTKNSLVPKSALLHSKEKYVLKRANSVVNSYSKHLGRLIQNRYNGNGNVACKQLALGSSISSDSTTHDIELQPPTEMLMIKNDPFSVFAQCLQNLVFLDLTDNQIDRISCLDGLTSLTVLLLGKNRITDISGVIGVKMTLRVLDLHGNKISSITQKICQLQQLKSLNLAANNLRQIHDDDFKGLTQLKELNIKRNRIKKINGFDDLQALERLWMCHNEIEKVAHLSCLRKLMNLREITIENNPISLGGDCISFLVSYLKRLTSFNQMHITDQVRRAAMEWRKNKELYDSNPSELSSDIRREEIISNARTNWELLRSQQPQKLSNHNHQKPINSTTIPRTITNECGGDVESNLSENVIIDRKLIRQKAQTIRKNLRKSVKMKRSLSQDNNSSNATNEFRLPPITPIASESVLIDASLNASASSIGVNVDSASSHFISENEDNVKKSTEDLSRMVKECETEKAIVDSNFIAKSDVNHPICENEREVVANMSEIKPANTTDIADNLEIDESANNTTIANETIDKDALAGTGTLENTVNNIASEKTSLHRTKSIIKRSCQQHTMLQRSQTAKVINLISPVPATIISQTPKPPKQLDREREQGGDYLIEISGRYLNVYGSGAIKFIDRQWNAQKANDVHTLKFSYANFNNVATIFGKIKNRFPNAENYAFRETNIQFFGQLNALAELQGLKSLYIDAEGNPISSKDWRQYAVYRLSHWGLKIINDQEITKEEIDAAQHFFEGLSNLVLWSLPESTIEPLLLRLNLEESCTNVEKIKPKQWLMSADLSLRTVVGKEALQCKLTPNTSNPFVQESEFRNRGRQCLSTMVENTYNAVEKLQKLETMWSGMLLDIVKATLLDYAQMDAYIEQLMFDLNSTNKT